MAKTKIAVLFGGKSGEHDISCISATSVIKAIDKEKYDIITIGITRQGMAALLGPAGSSAVRRVGRPCEEVPGRRPGALRDNASWDRRKEP